MIGLARKVKKGVTFSGRGINMRIKQATPEGEKALDKFVHSNLRLSIREAKKFQGEGLELLDLIQHGNIGLIVAVAKYDPERGFRFSTYATWWVRKAITQAIFDEGRSIRLPAHIGEGAWRVRKTAGKMAQELGRQPTFQEIADRLNFSVEKVEKLLIESSQILSLNEPVSEDGRERGDGTVVEESKEDIVDVVAQRDIKETAQKLLSNLEDEREKSIIKWRFGFVDGGPYTLEEVGRKFGVTKERVRQIEKRALKKARTGLSRQQIKQLVN